MEPPLLFFQTQSEWRSYVGRFLSDYRRFPVVHHEPAAGAIIAQEFEISSAHRSRQIVRGS